MKAAYKILICLFIKSTFLPAQAVPAYYPDLSKPYSQEALLQDAGILKSALRKLHPGLFWYMNEDEFEKRYQTFIDSLNGPRNEWQFHKQLLKFMSGVRCGHTYALLSPPVHKYLGEKIKLFPFEIAIIDSSMFIRKNFTELNGLDPGTEILSINDIPLRTLYATLKQYTWVDGFYKHPDLTALDFPVHFALQYGFTDTFWVDVKTPKGERFYRAVPAMTSKAMDQADRTKYPQSTAARSFSFIPETKTAVLDINVFLGGGFKRYLRKSFNKIEKLGATNVVIDLRSNGGGRDDYPRWLFQYIARQPFKYYDRLEAREINTHDSIFRYVKGGRIFRIGYRMNYFKKTGTGVCYMKNAAHSNLRDGMFEPKSNAFNGPVYLLLNNHSFSASTELAAVASCNKRCTIIGQETMGGYCGNNSGTEFMLTLPNTKGRIFIPTYRYISACKDCPYGRGVSPDIQAYPTVGDFSGGDSVMNLTLELIRKHDQ